MFNKILIANRGEIACRIIHTATRLGIRTVSVYSEADSNARHVDMADEAVAIGPAPARDSYLAADKLIDVVVRSGAEAIHPGYGFLSENAGFAATCADAGIVFIGPSPRAIEAMGSKSAAKTIMEQAGVPLLPGYHGDNQDQAFLLEEAERIGFPVMLKASAGGGGRGMRVVSSAAEFGAALHSAKREALGAFNDETMLLEKYLEGPRHIEIQVFCDNQGNALHLFERDCSIQRRHQKVLEEAPAPGLTDDARNAMGAAAVNAAKAIDYRGAGTVEFIVDREGKFYFMEMNTRLQVEHPVTEMITGQDLVEWQLRVAAGEPLPADQDKLAITGHALEARIYAEDPEHGFLPATGSLSHLRFPARTAQVRVDTGVRQGDTISVHYDPLIAKLIVHGSDRKDCLRRMQAALNSTRVAGVTTNIDFLASILSHEAFHAANIDTGFIERHLPDLIPDQTPADPTILALAALYLVLQREASARGDALSSNDPASPWWTTDGWRPNLIEADCFTFHDGVTEQEVRVTAVGEEYLIHTAGQTISATASLTADGTLTATLDGSQRRVEVIEDHDQLLIFDTGATHRLKQLTGRAHVTEEETAGNLISPMPGTVIEVMVTAGQQVKKGDILLILEAMKIEHTITAPRTGTVKTLHYQSGAMVEEGVELLRLVDG